ncbi:hypothetical protein SAMN05216283_102727 [Sunxiuqinia elliptica]|uniref:Sulfatase n=1 Tax=Sunxiuqinia elliptica TaxID=655355 RepID=A0A1I2G3V0_9BACT|nr:hypothetical protein SAMN05216283_102727 [Sunxiuqinia elliptica]
MKKLTSILSLLLLIVQNLLSAQDHTNVIYIMADDLGVNVVSCHGQKPPD